MAIFLHTVKIVNTKTKLNNQQKHNVYVTKKQTQSIIWYPDIAFFELFKLTAAIIFEFLKNNFQFSVQGCKNSKSIMKIYLY